MKKIKSGEAAIINYISDHGRTHCAVPKNTAIDIKKDFPNWIRLMLD